MRSCMRYINSGHDSTNVVLLRKRTLYCTVLYARSVPDSEMTSQWKVDGLVASVGERYFIVASRRESYLPEGSGSRHCRVATMRDNGGRYWSEE